MFCGKVSRSRSIARAAHLANMVVFVLFPGICAKVFAVLKCKQIIDKSYLVADFSVECWVGEHRRQAAWALVCLVVYVIGIPATTLFILCRNRRHLYDITSPKYSM